MIASMLLMVPKLLVFHTQKPSLLLKLTKIMLSFLLFPKPTGPLVCQLAKHRPFHNGKQIMVNWVFQEMSPWSVNQVKDMASQLNMSANNMSSRLSVTIHQQPEQDSTSETLFGALIKLMFQKWDIQRLLIT